MTDLHYDLCVIGGGINGVGIARDAVGRGLSVLLVEADDLAGATSSASTKLIHGGLRYLEQREFGLVRKSLKERETLYKNAPHLIQPISCVLPHDDGQRPQWVLRCGLWLYDRIGGQISFPKSKVTSFDGEGYGQPLLTDYTSGFVYSDCWVDDTRLVVLNAVDAASRNAKILTRTSCEEMDVIDGRWRVGLRDVCSQERIDISASMVVNATGPWVSQFLKSVGIGGSDPDLPSVRLVKGSHLLLPMQYEGDHAYVLQQPDKRIVFVAPYEGKYTLVGTTEEDFFGDPRDARISDAEMGYLCDALNSAFTKKITPSDVVFTFSGIRPLLDDGEMSASEVTRDHLIYHHSRYDPPFLSVFGGKLTTHRILAEEVVDRLVRISGHSDTGAWTGNEPLTGGDFGGLDFDAYLAQQAARYPWLPDDVVMRYVRSYGARMDYFLYSAQGIGDLGVHHGDGVYQAELDYLVTYEWAHNVEDIIWRRSKLGMHISDETLTNIEAALTAA